MAARTHSRREEIQLELLEFELIERRVILAVYVLVTFTAAVATIVCVLAGYPWPAPSITSVASTTALIVGGRRSRRPPTTSE